MVGAPARRELVCHLKQQGLSERRSLTVVQMSPSAFRYQPRPDRNSALRQEIIQLAQQYKRYGAPMIYLKLRQANWPVNHKRVERIYQQEGLQIKRRKRKKVPVADRQPLIRPQTADQVWSMDFVFDRVADGRLIKTLAIVDDATTECVALIPRHGFNGLQVTQALEQLKQTRGLPMIIRTDNGKEFIGKAMLSYAYKNGIEMKPIEPGKPNQNAYVESFNGRFRDECLNEHWFLNLYHAKVIIESWSKEYNEQRPKKQLHGMTPSAYAERMASVG